MLDEVVGDDEILRAVADARERFAVIENVDVDERLSRELRIFPAQIGDAHPVDVPDARRGRHFERIVQRPDLETVTAQVGARDRPAAQ